MDEATKRKFNANIKAVNRDLIEILEKRLPTDELIKLKFEGIRILIDDCQRLALKENEAKNEIEAQISELQEKLKNL
jgi:hypothetical protein